MPSNTPNTPNILFIQADQLTSFALGCYGHPVARTPHLDRLAAEGALFVNAYCNSPLCGPSRNSMMAGRLPHAVGSYDNANELPASTPTFAHVLRNEGYACWLSGKMHFVGPDQLHGFHGRTNTDIYPAGFNWTPDWSRGTYPNHGTSIRYLHQSGPCAWSLQLDYDEETAARGLRCLRDLVRAHGAVEGSRAAPFFLGVSFTHPHDPFVVQRSWWDAYDGVEIPAPTAPARELSEMHPFDRWIQIHHEVDAYPPSEETVRNARRAYLGMTSYVDEKVGELLAELDRLGIADDTVVIFSSDHGDMQGEHGMWYKRTWREWSMRVPLIIRDPRVSGGRRIDAPVSLVDLFPTIADLAGASPDWPGAEDLDGRSLVPSLSGRDEDLQERPVFAEYCGEGAIEPLRMVRRGTWKYVEVNGQPPVLIDLEADPAELENLAGDRRTGAIESELRLLARTGWDGDALRDRIVADQQQRLFLDRALQSGGEVSWDYRPVEDAATRYVRRGNSTQGTKRRHRWPYVPPADR